MDSFSPFIQSNNMDEKHNEKYDEKHDEKNIYVNTLKILKSEVDEYSLDFLNLIHVEIPEYENFIYHIYGNNNFYLGGKVNIDKKYNNQSNNTNNDEGNDKKYYFSFKHLNYNKHYFISIIIKNKTYTQFYEYKKELSPLPLPKPNLKN